MSVDKRQQLPPPGLSLPLPAHDSDQIPPVRMRSGRRGSERGVAGTARAAGRQEPRSRRCRRGGEGEASMRPAWCRAGGSAAPRGRLPQLLAAPRPTQQHAEHVQRHEGQPRPVKHAGGARRQARWQPRPEGRERGGGGREGLQARRSEGTAPPRSRHRWAAAAARTALLPPPRAPRAFKAGHGRRGRAGRAGGGSGGGASDRPHWRPARGPGPGPRRQSRSRRATPRTERSRARPGHRARARATPGHRAEPRTARVPREAAQLPGTEGSPAKRPGTDLPSPAHPARPGPARPRGRTGRGWNLGGRVSVLRGDHEEILLLSLFCSSSSSSTQGKSCFHLWNHRILRVGRNHSGSCGPTSRLKLRGRLGSILF